MRFFASTVCESLDIANKLDGCRSVGVVGCWSGGVVGWWGGVSVVVLVWLTRCWQVDEVGWCS